MHRAYKICSTHELLNNELQHIKNFLSWNGFSRKLSAELINQFKPSTNHINNENVTTGCNKDEPMIWIPLPYLGDYGNRLTGRFLRSITPLLNRKCDFIINWKTTNINSIVSCKDKTPLEYHSSVVYQFSCPGCKASYIGKTERCFHTRIKEHARDSKSEIFNHITSCDNFQHIKTRSNFRIPSHKYSYSF